MKIVIIGTGNVATVMGRSFMKAGFTIAQVYGRKEQAARLLAEELDCSHCHEWGEINKDADLYIAAIADKAIWEMGEALTLPGRLIVHTAGSVSMESLRKVAPHYGILYPLQSIRKELPPASGIPILVDGNSEAVKARLIEIASHIADRVVETNDESRAKLHVAAVIVNNFTNHLYALAEDYCSKESLDFKLLLPLIQETAGRMQFITPEEALTGPAIRKDESTIEKHLLLLAEYPSLQQIYRQLTASIQQFNKKK